MESFVVVFAVYTDIGMNLRIATFNLENLDIDEELEKRIPILRPQLLRLDADILCFQEVHGQDGTDGKKHLLALAQLLKDTPYERYFVKTTLTQRREAFTRRNVVTVSRLPVFERKQYLNTLTPPPKYKSITAIPPKESARNIGWERPILHTLLELENGEKLHVINIHFKSKHPTPIDGQKIDRYTWASSAAWAEGFFLSSMKRVGQAIETRFLVDRIINSDEEAKIIVCGDFNAEAHEVPIQAICSKVENTGNPDLGVRVLIPTLNSIPELSRYSIRYHGENRLFDHVLISRSLLPNYRETEIHNEILPDESIAFATDTKFPESDHAPIVVEFEF